MRNIFPNFSKQMRVLSIEISAFGTHLSLSTKTSVWFYFNYLKLLNDSCMGGGNTTGCHLDGVKAGR